MMTLLFALLILAISWSISFLCTAAIVAIVVWFLGAFCGYIVTFSWGLAFIIWVIFLFVKLVL